MRAVEEGFNAVILFLLLYNIVLPVTAPVARIVVFLKDKAIITSNLRLNNKLEDFLVVCLEVYFPVSIGGNLILVEAVFKAIVTYSCLCMELLLLLIKGFLGLYLLYKAIWAASFLGALADVNMPLRAVAKMHFIREFKGVLIFFL